MKRTNFIIFFVYLQRQVSILSDNGYHFLKFCKLNFCREQSEEQTRRQGKMLVIKLKVITCNLLLINLLTKSW